MIRAFLALTLLAPFASAQVALEKITPAPATPKVIATPEFLAKVKTLEAILDKALTAYNAGDAKAFWADAAKTATPAPTPGTFAALYEGYYKADFGMYVSKKLIDGETVPDASLGVLVYEAKFDKIDPKKKVKISANFTREDGALKLMQVRFEKM